MFGFEWLGINTTTSQIAPPVTNAKFQNILAEFLNPTKYNPQPSKSNLNISRKSGGKCVISSRNEYNSTTDSNFRGLGYN